VLKLYALALLRCEQPGMLVPLLCVLLEPLGTPAALFAAGNNGKAAGEPVGMRNGAPAALTALHAVCSLLPEEPSLKSTPPELLALQSDMTLDDISVTSLLTQPAVMEAAGVVTLDDYGQPVFDFPVRRRRHAHVTCASMLLLLLLSGWLAHICPPANY
jgi:hypothetical protein